VRVTRIEAQKKRPGRKNVYIDGKFAIGIGTETLLRTGLRTGDEIDTLFLTTLERTERTSALKASALRLLSYRARSVREMRDRLRQKKFPKEEIGTVIGELERAGLLDDQRFARMLIRDQMTLRPSGKAALRQKLLRHGVSRTIADEALQEVLTESSEETGAEQVARKYLTARVRPGSDPLVIRKRLAGFLTRRGYSWDMIKPLLARLLPAQETEQAE
jgi:regulatory protein